MPSRNPTKKTYDGLTTAYDFFNERLFGGKQGGQQDQVHLSEL